jgi:hypothetical protein
MAEQIYSQGPGAEESRRRQAADQGYAFDPNVADPPVGSTANPAPAPLPADGGVTQAQHYSIATSASRDELMALHTLLVEADKKVLSILERFQQG